MADWNEKKVNKENINSGREYSDYDILRPNDVNSIVNNSLYSVKVVDNLNVTAQNGNTASAEIITDDITGLKTINLTLPQGVKGEQGIQGKSIFMNESYNSNSTYYNNTTRLDVVFYNGTTYYPKSESVSGVIPTNAEYWNVFCLKGADGLGGNITANNLNQVSANQSYVINVVAVNGNVLTCQLLPSVSEENVVVKNQGNNNANSIMITDSLGNVIPKKASETSVGKLNDINGSYYVRGTNGNLNAFVNGVYDKTATSGAVVHKNDLFKELYSSDTGSDSVYTTLTGYKYYQVEVYSKSGILNGVTFIVPQSVINNALRYRESYFDAKTWLDKSIGLHIIFDEGAVHFLAQGLNVGNVVIKKITGYIKE